MNATAWMAAGLDSQPAIAEAPHLTEALDPSADTSIESTAVMLRDYAPDPDAQRAGRIRNICRRACTQLLGSGHYGWSVARHYIQAGAEPQQLEGLMSRFVAQHNSGRRFTASDLMV